MFESLRRFITPPDFQDEETNRIARILFPLLIIFGIALIVILFTFWGNLIQTLILGGVLALVLVSLVLTWRGWVKIPGWLVTVSSVIALTYLIAVGGDGLYDPGIVGYPFIIVLAATLLGAPGVVVLSVLTILALSGLAYAEVNGLLVMDYTQGASYDDLIRVGILIGLTGAALFVLVRSLMNTLQEARRNAAALTKANRELEEVSGALEARVAARTRDLTLAAEIGRTLSQVQELDRLMQQSVERIQGQFDLYYAQIYLADEGKRTLVLRAGTGEVGRELQRRGHRLPLSQSSINSSAALYKRPVIVSDTLDDPTFQPNPLLPHTRSEMAVPLLLGEEVVGVLNLQAAESNALTQENLPAFEALAGQLAVAVRNARLLAEVSEANAEFQAYARRLTRQQWNVFLDALHHEEQIGYVYAGGEIASLAEAPPDGHGAETIEVPIEVGGEIVGAIQIEADPGQPIPPETRQIVAAIAGRVGQQVENLRLLEEAERYRSEAEATMRRVTREQWREHQELSELTLSGYTYDANRIEAMAEPESDTADLEPDLVRHPLRVRGETVGYLEAAGDDGKEAAEMVTAVADQLSAHLENLRLSAQTERALAAAQQRSEELININHIISLVSTSMDLQESLHLIAIELAQTLDMPQVHVALFNDDKSELEIAAAFSSDDSLPGLEGDRFEVSGLPLYERLLAMRESIRLSTEDEMLQTAPIYDVLRERSIISILLIPMMVGNEIIGAVSIHGTDPEHELSGNQQQVAETIVYQASAAVENARLLAQTEAALSEMAALSQIGASLNAAQSYEDVVVAVSGVLRSRTNNSLSAALFHVAVDEREQPVRLQLMATDGTMMSEAMREPIPVQRMPGFHLWQANPEGAFLISDVATDTRLTEADRELFRVTDTRSAALLPLRLGSRWIGYFGVLWKEPVSFSDEDERFYKSVEDELALVVNNLQLLEATQRQARQEQTLRQITSRVYAAPNAESILRAAAQEVNRALNLEAFAYLEEETAGNGRSHSDDPTH